jgi:hypothetical protein
VRPVDVREAFERHQYTSQETPTSAQRPTLGVVKTGLGPLRPVRRGRG